MSPFRPEHSSVFLHHSLYSSSVGTSQARSIGASGASGAPATLGTAQPVAVEVDISSGLPSFATVGLPNGAVREGRQRITAALANAGYVLPLKRITVNLAPADIHKSGSGLDLPIALGVLVASGQLPEDGLRELMVVGEVGLEGDLRPVRGALPMALAARAAGCRGLLVPAENVPEAAVVEGLE